MVGSSRRGEAFPGRCGSDIRLSEMVHPVGMRRVYLSVSGQVRRWTVDHSLEADACESG